MKINVWDEGADGLSRKELHDGDDDNEDDNDDDDDDDDDDEKGGEWSWCSKLL